MVKDIEDILKFDGETSFATLQSELQNITSKLNRFEEIAKKQWNFNV